MIEASFADYLAAKLWPLCAVMALLGICAAGHAFANGKSEWFLFFGALSLIQITLLIGYFALRHAAETQPENPK